MALRRSGNESSLAIPQGKLSTAEERGVLNEEAFQRMIAIERKRTERSRKPFLLMLLDAGDHAHSSKALTSIVPVLLSTTRETDVVGWYKDGSMVGVIFTGTPRR